jgi:hypothetical protein
MLDFSALDAGSQIPAPGMMAIPARLPDRCSCANQDAGNSPFRRGELSRPTHSARNKTPDTAGILTGGQVCLITRFRIGSTFSSFPYSFAAEST